MQELAKLLWIGWNVLRDTKNIKRAANRFMFLCCLYPPDDVFVSRRSQIT